MALGESIVAIGVGVAGLALSWPIVAASVLGLTVSAALWWAYFDVSARLAEQGLAAEPEDGRARLARDAYSYLHLPMLAGVVLLVLGMKKVLEYVGDTGAHDLGDRLAAVPAGALPGGVAIYLLAHVGFTWRAARHVSRPRLVVAGLALALVPVAARVPALAALAMVAVLAAGLVAYECVRFAKVRDEVRHGTTEDGPVRDSGHGSSDGPG